MFVFHKMSVRKFPGLFSAQSTDLRINLSFMKQQLSFIHRLKQNEQPLMSLATPNNAINTCLHP